MSKAQGGNSSCRLTLTKACFPSRALSKLASVSSVAAFTAFTARARLRRRAAISHLLTEFSDVECGQSAEWDSWDCPYL